MHEYTRGTRGPKEADALRKSVGHVTCPVPRDGALLSSSDDLCAEAPVGNERAETGLGTWLRCAWRPDDAASEDDGTPKHERRRSGVPASVVAGEGGGGNDDSEPPPEA